MFNNVIKKAEEVIESLTTREETNYYLAPEFLQSLGYSSISKDVKPIFNNDVATHLIRSNDTPIFVLQVTNYKDDIHAVDKQRLMGFTRQAGFSIAVVLNGIEAGVMVCGYSNDYVATINLQQPGTIAEKLTKEGYNGAELLTNSVEVKMQLMKQIITDVLSGKDSMLVNYALSGANITTSEAAVSLAQGCINSVIHSMQVSNDIDRLNKDFKQLKIEQMETEGQVKVEDTQQAEEVVDSHNSIVLNRRTGPMCNISMVGNIMIPDRRGDIAGISKVHRVKLGEKTFQEKTSTRTVLKVIEHMISEYENKIVELAADGKNDLVDIIDRFNVLSKKLNVKGKTWYVNVYSGGIGQVFLLLIRALDMLNLKGIAEITVECSDIYYQRIQRLNNNNLSTMKEGSTGHVQNAATNNGAQGDSHAKSRYVMTEGIYQLTLEDLAVIRNNKDKNKVIDIYTYEIRGKKYNVETKNIRRSRKTYGTQLLSAIMLSDRIMFSSIANNIASKDNRIGLVDNWRKGYSSVPTTNYYYNEALEQDLTDFISVVENILKIFNIPSKEFSMIALVRTATAKSFTGAKLDYVQLAMKMNPYGGVSKSDIMATLDDEYVKMEYRYDCRHVYNDIMPIIDTIQIGAITYKYKNDFGRIIENICSQYERLSKDSLTLDGSLDLESKSKYILSDDKEKVVGGDKTVNIHGTDYYVSDVENWQIPAAITRLVRFGLNNMDEDLRIQVGINSEALEYYSNGYSTRNSVKDAYIAQYIGYINECKDR